VGPAPALRKLATFTSERLVKKVQRIGSIVHVVDALSNRDQTEQRTGTRGVTRTVEQSLRDLLPIWRRLDHIPVVSID